MKKKLFCILLTVVLLLSSFPIGVLTVSAETATLAGSGTEASPYLIGSKDDLLILASMSDTTGKYFLQTADIDLYHVPWTPINGFNGVYDGNYHVIKDLYVTGVTSAGLFGTIPNSPSFQTVIKNLAVTGIIKGSVTHAGGVVAVSNNNLKLENVYTDVDITLSGSGKYVGGLLAWGRGQLDIVGCVSEGDITLTNGGATFYIGGLIGSGTVKDTDGTTNIVNTSRNIHNSYYTGNITVSANGNSGNMRLGGIAGAFMNGVTIANTHMYGTVSYSNATASAANQRVGYFVGGFGYAQNGAANPSSVITASTYVAPVLNESLPGVKSTSNSDITGLTKIAGGMPEVPFVSGTFLETVAAYTDGADLVIDSAQELMDFATAVNNGNTYAGKTVALTADLDMAGYDWTPIGGGRSTEPGNSVSHGIYFAGTFDGYGHTVSNLSFDTGLTACWQVGLFGAISGATVKNVCLKDPTFYNGNMVGALVGFATNSTITNCSVTGLDIDIYQNDIDSSGATVRIYDNAIIAGGLIGVATNAMTVSNCYCEGEIDLTRVTRAAGAIVGGFVGSTMTGNELNKVFTNCYTDTHIVLLLANVSTVGASRIGSFAGNMLNNATLNTCVSLNTLAYTITTVDDTAINFANPRDGAFIGSLGHGNTSYPSSMTNCYCADGSYLDVPSFGGKHELEYIGNGANYTGTVNEGLAVIPEVPFAARDMFLTYTENTSYPTAPDDAKLWVESIRIGGVDISEYTIVSNNTAAQQAASDLYRYIYNASGISVPITYGTTVPAKAIVVGEVGTSYPASAANYGDVQVSMEGTVIHINATDILGLETGASYLASRLTEAENVNLTAIEHSESFLAEGETWVSKRAEYAADPTTFLPSYRYTVTTSEKELSYADKAARLNDPLGNVMVIAHRGDETYYPEDSLEGIISAWLMGADAAEIDLRQTKDGEWVLLHDASLTRTTNVDAMQAADSTLPSSDNISDWTFAQVRQLKLKDQFGAETPFVIPTFEEIMRAANDRLFLNLDNKSTLSATDLYNNVVFPMMESLNAYKCLYVTNVCNNDYSGMETLSKHFSGETLETVLRLNTQSAFESQAQSVINADITPAVIYRNDYYKNRKTDMETVAAYAGQLRIGSLMQQQYRDYECFWDQAYESGFNLFLTDKPLQMLEAFGRK